MKKLIILLSVIFMVIFVILTMSYTGKKGGKISTNNIKADEKGFVLMELFTSQGCSSCPPADEILGSYTMKNNEHIIPIAFHVDYWNRLGWVDSFSNSKYSQRQQAYAGKFNLESVYTPQLIINGRKELVGNEQVKIVTIVNSFLKESTAVTISISDPAITGNKVFIPYTLSSIQPNTSINAALIQNHVFTQIKAGENRGEKLDNYNVVRDFITLRLANAVGKISLQLPKGSMTTDYSIVLFVQEDVSGKITGAVKLKL